MESGIVRVLIEIVGGVVLAVFSRWWAKKKPEAVNTLLIQEIEKVKTYEKAVVQTLKSGIQEAAEKVDVQKYLHKKVRELTPRG